ncbi:MAG: hypothetical protein PSU94_09000 [Lacunisphaera sp.]|nr:hypothetical protein [Lacunisphaera sp.]
MKVNATASTAASENTFSQVTSRSMRARLAAAKRFTPVSATAKPGYSARTAVAARAIAANAGACPASLSGEAASRAQTSVAPVAADCPKPSFNRSTAPGMSSSGSAGMISEKARAPGVVR